MTVEVRHRGVERERGIRPVRLVAPTSVAAAITAAVTYVAVRNPYENNLTGPCALFHATGLYCPGCGATRAAYDLTQGDVLHALQMNAFFTVFIVPAAIVGMVWWVAAIAGFNVPQAQFSGKVIWSVVGLIALFWIVRNLPWFAPYLAP